MTLHAVFHVALTGVRRRPLRTLLTSLSLLIGVITLVLVQGSSVMIRQAMVQRAVLQSGPRTTVLVPLIGDEDLSGFGGPGWQQRVARAVRDIAGEVAELSRYDSMTLIADDGATLPVDVATVSNDIRRIRPFRLVGGSWLPGSTQGSSLVPPAMLNLGASGALPSSEGGAWLATRGGLDRLRVHVVGVVDDGSDAPAAYFDTADTARLRLAGMTPMARALLVSSQEASQGLLAQRVQTLSAVLGRSGEIGDISRIDQVDSFGDQMTTAHDLFLLIAVMSLTVGSLGILNIGLATLRERAEEVALRRALGATRTKVALVLIVESQIIAFVSSIGAIALSVLLVPLALDQLSAVPLEAQALPVAAIAVGVVASGLAALVGSLAPSIKAASLPVASLLR